ncbi:MAG: hypothetical protein DRG30_06770 [Epsilonproteobacteria bacterium]|nr:MAG: hypothetical protein DRG30_06770 [Campylobacterota bacterium]
MSLYKTVLSTSIICSTLLFTACTSSKSGPRQPKPMDTHGKSLVFIKGAEDGCTTANGDYSKDHDAFNNDIEYHKGWFAGRKYCEVRSG